MAELGDIHYGLTLDVDLENFTTEGEVRIEVDVEEPTDTITLNADDMEVTSCRVLAGGEELICRRGFNEEDQELRLQFRENVSGNVIIIVEYEGVVREGLAGLYRSSYEEDGEKRWLATTQLEAADARRVLPCFDRPNAKATFDVTLIHDKELAAVSNMPVAEQADEGERVRTRFETTPKMSTYLLYIGVGDFDCIEDDSGVVPVRVYATRGQEVKGRFAIEVAKQVLEYYNDYFGVEYPLPKLDMIAVPDFAAGAMENWGAVTYRESALLVDEDDLSVSRKRRVVEVVAHELAHMWFGNLVTMDWWDDLWLNESFADWLAHKAGHHFYPELRFWESFLGGRASTAYGLDSLKTSHPIHVDVDSPEEIREVFDMVSYAKGGSVLRMIESYLGEEDFRKGLQKYISDHAYDNTVAADLWDSLGEASGEPVAEIMEDWIKQVGHPIVRASMDGDTLKLEQERFLYEPVKDDTLWEIPAAVDIGGDERTILVEDSSHSVELGGTPDYLLINTERAGFYRVQYSPTLIDSLKLLISSGELGTIDRWSVQYDTFSLARACEISFNDYVELLDAYTGEDTEMVAGSIMGALSTVYLLADDDLRRVAGEKLAAFARSVLDNVGWDPDEDEDETVPTLRAAAIAHLGRLGDEEVAENAQRRFDEFLDDGELDPDIRAAVYVTVAWNRGASHEKFKELFLEEDESEEKVRFLRALSAFQDPELLTETLEFSMTDDVRPQDAYTVPIFVSRNIHGRDMVWPWVKDNWDQIYKTYGEGGGLNLMSRFVKTASVLSSPDAEQDVREFFEDAPSEGTSRAIDQTCEKIRINHRFLERNG